MKALALSAAETIISQQNQTGRILCPFCAHTRKSRNQRIKTCVVTVYNDRVVYDCHHCGNTGKVSTEYRPHVGQQSAKVTSIPTDLKRDEDAIIGYFAGRGIELSDLSTLPPMVTGKKWFREAGKEVPALGFVYGPKENPRAIKWRPLKNKAFTQDGSATEFYGLDQLNPNDKTLVIVEGEVDVIALASVGIRAISVPNGAPSRLSAARRTRPEDDKKFGYVWESKDLLEAAERVILATDNDEPGVALMEELARRIGRAKCWKPVYPPGCKDFGDVVAKCEEGTAQEILKKAEPLPLQGIYGAKEYLDRLNEVYAKGLTEGLSTGYSDVDNLFTVNPGRLFIVTGYPGSGKSEFIDQIAVNLAQQHHWKFAVASFENPPHIHISKLAEKIVGKPFYDGPTPRMTEADLNSAVEFVDEHFLFLESKDGDLPTIASVMDRTKQAVMRLGVRGLIIDPYNYIHRDNQIAEYEWVSQVLTQMSNFAKAHDLDIFFVAHPTKLQPREDGSYPVPKGNQISGSAAWFAKADVGITVHRVPAGVEIHCWKARFKWEGSVGMCMLSYDVPTGRYFPFSGTKKIDKPASGSHWMDDFDDDDDILDF